LVFGRVYRRYGETISSSPSFFPPYFTVSIGGGVRRFVPMIMVVERGDATGAWHWKGLPTRTTVFERRSVLLGRNYVKKMHYSHVVEMHLEITN
jgi:hypothetical protein